MVGLLGENGSGKTTTIRLIMGMLVPSYGEVSVFGEDPLYMQPATRARIGYIADEMGLPDTMTLGDGMRLHASYFPTWDNAFAGRLLKRFDLYTGMHFGTLSKGQKRRYLLALIVAQRPEFLVLDEPAGGLDTVVRRQFLDLLIELANERALTVLISSHLLPDVERVVDRVAFVKAGRLVTQGALEDLKSNVKRLIFQSGDDVWRGRERFHVLKEDRGQGAIRLVVDNYSEEKAAGLFCTTEHLNLEELFLVYNGLQPGKA